jgi:hypothetical protein
MVTTNFNTQNISTYDFASTVNNGVDYINFRYPTNGASAFGQTKTHIISILV